MAAGPAPPAPPPIEPLSKRERDECQAFIEQRLSRTQRQVKLVDIAAGLLALGAGTLSYLLIAAILDHWLIPGGLGFSGRMVLLLGLVLGAGYYGVAYLLPLVIRRINPVFAAHTIERHRPSLKNSLVNLLFLRRDPQRLSRDQLSLRIYRGMEENAAAELADPSVEAAVDRGAVVRFGYVLAAVLALAAIYLALSPKSPLVSFRRVMLPWAEIDPPTRVTIARVEPGNTVAFQGDSLTVSAEVRGIRSEEAVSLYFTTADGQSVNEAIPMTLPEGEYRYRCQLPPGSLGLQQDLCYLVAAGDAKTRPFEVKVEIPLTILADQVHYDYPDYTGIADRTSPGGDLRAIEGTKVRIEATASRPISRAAVELDCDPRNAVLMNADGTRATAAFTLRMDPKDRAVPEYDSYQLRFRDADGRDNPRPIRHEIDVIADLPPDVRFVDPPDDKIELPLNATLQWTVRAEDPDFALRRVAVRAECNGRSLAIEPLLDRPRPEQPFDGSYETTYRFEPSKFKLKPGDKVTYWAEADDNKEPIGNHSETPQRTLLIIEPASQDEPPPGDDHAAAGRPESEQKGPAPQNGQPQEEAGERGGDQSMQQSGEKPQPQPEEPKQQEPNQPQEEQQGGQKDDKQKGDTGQTNGSAQQQEGTEKSDQTSQGQKAQEPQEGQQSQGQQQGSAQQGEGQKSPDGNQPNQSAQQDPAGQPSGQSSDTPAEPVDGETNPGEAIERILEHRRDQQQKQDAATSQQQPGQSDPQQPGEQPKGQDADQSAQQQPGEPSGAPPQDAMQQPSGKQPPSASEQAGGQDAGSEKSQSGQSESGSKPAGDQPSQPQDKPPGGPPSQQGSDSKPGDQQASDGQKPAGGENAENAGGKPDEEPPKPQTGQGEPQPGDQNAAPQTPQSDAGSGKPSQGQQGTPSPQEASQPRDKKPDQGKQEETSGQESSSPSTSPKDSDSQGDDAGDRSGGGGQGGGQQANQPGPGSPGSKMPADQGGEPSSQQGKGETGSKGGDQAKSQKPTGEPGTEAGEPGSGRNGQQGGQQTPNRSDQQNPPEKPEGEPGQSGSQQGTQSSGKQPGDRNVSGSGNPTQGGMPGQQEVADSQPESKPMGADDPNLKYANEQTELALEHLKEQLAKEKPEVLDHLGWDRKQAEEFVRSWEKMRRDARQPNEQGKAARKDFNSALNSLGLRPRGTELEGGRSTTDQLDKLRESRRYEPPAEWADLFRAYTKGLGETRQPAKDR